MKKYPKMKPSGVEWIGDVPEEWKFSRLRYITKVVRGASPRPAGSPLYFNGSHTPWITVAELTKDDEKYLTEVSAYLTEEGRTQSRYIEPGTLMLSNSGATLGVPKIIKIGGCFNDGSVAFLDLEKYINQDFIYYFLKSMTGPYRDLAKGSGQPNLNTDIVKSTFIALPNCEEQLKIVQFIETKTIQINTTISEKERLIELFREERQAIINHAVTKGIRAGVKMKASGVEWIGEVPEGWEVKKLKYLLKETDGAIRTGPFGSQLKSSELDDNGSYKVYNQRSVLDNDFGSGSDFISNEKFEALKAFEIFPNDILITTRGTIGRCTIFPKNVQRGVLHPCLIRVQANEEKVLKEWVVNYCNGTTYFLDNVLLVSNSTTIDVIYGYTLKEVFFPVPSIQEQSEILAYLNDKTTQIDTAISGIRQEIALLQEYRQALIFEAVTGKVDVQEST